LNVWWHDNRVLLAGAAPKATRFPRQANLKRVASGQVASNFFDQNAGAGAGLATTTRAAPLSTEAVVGPMKRIIIKLTFEKNNS
jgi:hypothetical protein